MGLHTTRQLRALGHRVIGVDLKEADVIADLSTPHGRRTASDEVLAAAGGALDGAVLAAGVGPGSGVGRNRLIAEVNFLGVVEPLTAWRPALAAADRAKVVVIASNSTTTVPAVPRRTIRALLDHDPDRAVRSIRLLGQRGSALMYSASKTAVSRWVRQQAVSPAWAGAGIRLNALAPGAGRSRFSVRQHHFRRRRDGCVLPDRRLAPAGPPACFAALPVAVRTRAGRKALTRLGCLSRTAVVVCWSE